MTACAETSSPESCGYSGVDTFQGVKDVPLPRFCLRKRKPTPERGSTAIPSVSSALLSDIFADVADIIQEGNETAHEISSSAEPSESSKVEDSVTATLSSPPAKKSRTSLTHSISRSPKSFRWVGDLFFPSSNSISPSPITPSCSPPDLTSQVSYGNKKRTVVSQSQVSNPCTPSSLDPSPSFPHLPPAVSVSSCNTIPRVLSDLQASSPDADGKDSYGWFIETDHIEEKESIDRYSSNSSSCNLAFVASTAPSVGNYDAEVEWAKAADTVDSVLGDFF